LKGGLGVRGVNGANLQVSDVAVFGHLEGNKRKCMLSGEALEGFRRLDEGFVAGGYVDALVAEGQLADVIAHCDEYLRAAVGRGRLNAETTRKDLGRGIDEAGHVCAGVAVVDARDLGSAIGENHEFIALGSVLARELERNGHIHAGGMRRSDEAIARDGVLFGVDRDQVSGQLALLSQSRELSAEVVVVEWLKVEIGLHAGIAVYK
jgi:hypothetical protein